MTFIHRPDLGVTNEEIRSRLGLGNDATRARREGGKGEASKEKKRSGE